MLGCVVSLTSSHLSGSTIRDVNTVGCVLCSNSSFSSLLPSPNTDTNAEPSIILDGYSTLQYQDGTPYSFTESSGTAASSAVFSHCRFTGDNYQSNVRPLTFNEYPGTVSILSCSFENIVYTSTLREGGGAVRVVRQTQFGATSFTAKSSNFTSCSSRIVRRIRQEDSCLATNGGGGLIIDGAIDVSVVDTKFEHCAFTDSNDSTFGGGLSVIGWMTLIVERCRFIQCSSRHTGGAIDLDHLADLNISDTLVQDCHSGATGAIFVFRIGASEHLSFSHVLFDGNSVGDDTSFFVDNLGFGANASKPRFPDVNIIGLSSTVLPKLTFDDCFTTASSDSSGMVIGGDMETFYKDPERKWDPEFDKIGPLLTAEPTASVNKETGKIELEMKGKTPPISQEYEVTVADKRGTETRFRMLFSDGTGSLVSGSESRLEYNKKFTITSIVGVVPQSSSSRMTNDIEVPVAAWPFNLEVTPDFLTFTTPRLPPSVVSASLVALTVSLPPTLVIVCGVVAGLIYGFATR
ncbi:hypothetical protein BLNAU_13522 [Blattamonas nauphoetae]|uniref:Right handed beta helix domain-containing protein n=1 Tax=Blattamonas nauphoetae TaxID=2049346 RepID=A0ABQ9XJ70_9EUKA|nr:hypothetical protein BLNAU_13522 [Blattamonas nauphoetae]